MEDASQAKSLASAAVAEALELVEQFLAGSGPEPSSKKQGNNRSSRSIQKAGRRIFSKNCGG